MSVRIDQLESELAEKLANPLKNTIPGQYQLRVSLLDANGRKKRSNASADNWSPVDGRIEIRFESSAVTERTVAVPDNANSAKGQFNRSEALSAFEIRLLRALERAESTPGWSFVSLKKFRDEILPLEPFAPGTFQPTDVDWQEALRSVIEKRSVLLNKVHNPKSPQFPVTSIRLNRLMPEVQEILGHVKSDLDFQPIQIKGEPLSATILRERR